MMKKPKYDLKEIERKLTADTVPQGYVDWLLEYYGIKKEGEKANEHI